MKSPTTKKKISKELNKLRSEVKIIEEELKETEYDEHENPANYTTDELTVCRAINDMLYVLKFHQMLCENHNIILQNVIRQQNNIDGKMKQQSFDFPTFYSKILEQFQKLFNNNTSDILNQLVETLTESIQGPCKLNQKALVNAKILDSSREYIANFEKPNEIEHLGFESEDEIEGIGELKGKIVTLLTSLLEGEIDMDIITRMVFSFDQQVMKERMLTVYREFAQGLLQKGDEIKIQEISINQIDKRLEKFSFESSIAEAFEIYILMHSLADCVEGAAEWLNKQTGTIKNFTEDQWRAFEFIRSHTSRIEIVNNNNLQRIYFPVRPICRNMSVNSKANLVSNVPRETHAHKQYGLMDTVNDLIDEMNHIEDLNEMPIAITPGKLTLLKDFSSVVGFFINSLQLFYAEKKYHYREPDTPDWVQNAIQILGIIQGASSGILIFFYAINKKKLITQKAWRQFIYKNRETGIELIPNNDRLLVSEMSIEMTHLILMINGPHATEFNLEQDQDPDFGNWYTYSEFQIYNVMFFMTDSMFQYYVLYFGISILGYISQDIFYSFHLLDIINRIQTLQNVIESVTSNIFSLGLTLMLLMIIVYIFTSFTFFYIQQHMYDYGVNAYDSDIVGENNCKTMFQCYVSMLDKGLRPGGGIGDVTEPIHYHDYNATYMIKLCHDIAFLIVVKVIALNVLFGQIIDTFASLRDDKAAIDDDIKNKCFICSITKMQFDKHSDGGMERHIKKDHNMWDYVYYIVHLKSKPTSDLTGTESYILENFEQREIIWIPRMKALCLEGIDLGGDEPEDGNTSERRVMYMKWNKNIKIIEKNVQTLLDKITKKQIEEEESKENVKIGKKGHEELVIPHHIN